jgi:predicted RNase H-like HicB family nuclease
MSKYVAVFEKGDRNWSAYVPDLTGCVAAGETRRETEQLIRLAARLHLRSIREDGERVPRSRTHAEVISVE